MVDDLMKNAKETLPLRNEAIKKILKFYNDGYRKERGFRTETWNDGLGRGYAEGSREATTESSRGGSQSSRERRRSEVVEAANQISDVFDKIFFETKRTLIAYKNQYYGKAQNRIPKRGEQKRTQPSTKQVLEDRPVQTAGVRGDADIKATRATRAEQRQKAIISTATDLASSLGVKLNVIEDVNEIIDSNIDNKRRKRDSAT